ncbi:FliH/SctL family protein [Sulfitobacter sp. M368]|uniref:FliH/SctL family protein n=1 Tax=Sulfitobacter sp. M368 TaxID=2867021 RepID=UPI0021A8DA22|nr:FliH/SctL family protein [Sulfitobacter sp. M368]UWR17437.1 flagellar motor switch protein FliH [Sulfitobacter sp. M368]
MIDLFQRNFDTEPAEKPKDSPQDKMSELAAFAEQELRIKEARQEGFDAGRSVGRQDAQGEYDAAREERLTQERTAIRDQLNAVLEQDAELRRTSERDIVELFLGIAERLVPELLENYGTDLAIERIRQSVALARTDPVLTIRACPDVAEALQSEAPEWLASATRTAQIDVVADPELSGSAAQVRWKGGRLDYDIEQASIAVLASLATAAKEFNEATGKAG